MWISKRDSVQNSLDQWAGLLFQSSCLLEFELKPRDWNGRAYCRLGIVPDMLPEDWLACLECIRVSSTTFYHSLAFSRADSTSPHHPGLSPSSPNLAGANQALLLLFVDEGIGDESRSSLADSPITHKRRACASTGLIDGAGLRLGPSRVGCLRQRLVRYPRR